MSDRKTFPRRLGAALAYLVVVAGVVAGLGAVTFGVYYAAWFYR